MAQLENAATDRNNNFNLIRLGAAMAVLISHAWPLSYGRGAWEPLTGTTGHSLGTLAVYVFFIISGFFISASWHRSRDLTDFGLARGLRLLPALFVSLLLTVAVLGPLVTRLPLGDYLTDPQTLGFLPFNLTLLHPRFTLPGVFDHNPYPTVEGSIWTLQHEAACYAALALCGMVAARWPRALLAIGLGYVALWLAPVLPHRLEAWRVLSVPFLLGMLFWHLRAQLPLRLPVALGLGGLAALLHGTVLAYAALILALGYGVFWLGVVPGGAIRRFNRLGDYSYGVYIYAFPVQGLVAYLTPHPTPLIMIAVALPVTLCLAVLSWHWVERPALALRHRRTRGDQTICKAPTRAAPVSSKGRPA